MLATRSTLSQPPGHVQISRAAVVITVFLLAFRVRYRAFVQLLRNRRAEFATFTMTRLRPSREANAQAGWAG